MANTGSAKQILGQGDVFGGKIFNVIDYASTSASYSQSALETLSPSAFGFFNTILCVLDISLDTTGRYYAQAIPQQAGLTPWTLKWFDTTTGLQVAGAVNLSGITVKISAIGY